MLEAVSDSGAPQAVVDALVVRLGFQPLARLIADRPALRAAVLVEYRRQCAELRSAPAATKSGALRGARLDAMV